MSMFSGFIFVSSLTYIWQFILFNNATQDILYIYIYIYIHACVLKLQLYLELNNS